MFSSVHQIGNNSTKHTIKQKWTPLRHIGSEPNPRSLKVSFIVDNGDQKIKKLFPSKFFSLKLGYFCQI